MKKINDFLIGFIFLQTIFVFISKQSFSQHKVNWQWGAATDCFRESQGWNIDEKSRHHFADTEIDLTDNSTVAVGEFSGHYLCAPSIQVSSNSNIDGRIEGLITKFDANGQFQWANKISPTDPNSSAITQCRGISINNLGEIFVVGYTTADWTNFGAGLDGISVLEAKNPSYEYYGFIAKYNSDGEVIDVRMDPVIYNDVKANPTFGETGGSIFLTGAYDGWQTAQLDDTTLPVTEFDEEFALVSLDKDFNVSWVTSGYGRSEGTRLVVDIERRAIYVLGLFKGGFSVSTQGASSLPYNNVDAKFYAKFSTITGKVKWIKSICAPVDQSIDERNLFFHGNSFVNGDITLDKTGDIYIVGTHGGVNNFVQIGFYILFNNSGWLGNYAFKASAATGTPIWVTTIDNDDQLVVPESLVWYDNQLYVGGFEYIWANYFNKYVRYSFLRFASSANGDFNNPDAYYPEFHSNENIISSMFVNPDNGKVAIVGDFIDGSEYYPGLKLGDQSKPEYGNFLQIITYAGAEVTPFESRTGGGEGWVAVFEHKDPSSGNQGFNVERTQGTLAVKVSPNPVSSNENINFTITSETEEHLNISLMDIKGSIVAQGEYDVKEGKNSFTFSTSNLKAGIYFLKTRKNSTFITQKVVIK